MNRLMVMMLGLCVAPAWTVWAASEPPAPAPREATPREANPSTRPAPESQAPEAEPAAAQDAAKEDVAKGDAAAHEMAADMAPPPSRFFRRSGRRGERPVDWDAVQQFAVRHSPRRWSAFDSAQSASTGAMHARQFVAESFQKLMDLKDKEPDVYDCRVAQIECEDIIYGICADVRGGKLTAGQAAPQLHEAVNRLVDARLKERDVRVKKAAAALRNAQQKLARDQQQRAKMVDRQVNAIIDSGYVPVPPRRNREHEQRPDSGD
jgi:hypothetical protein